VLRRDAQAPYTNTDPLPLVCASLELYASVTGMRVHVASLADNLLNAQSVTFSPNHAASILNSSNLSDTLSATSTLTSSPNQTNGEASPPKNVSIGSSSPPGSPGADASSISLDAETARIIGAGLSLAGGIKATNLLSLEPQDVEDRSFHTKDSTFKYMYTTAMDKAENLNGRLDEMRKAMVDAYEGLGDIICDFGTISQVPTIVVGRIATATEGSLADGGRINAKSVFLEGLDVESSLTGVHRLTLDLSEIPGYSLFPGQVVAVKGINAQGNKIVAQAIYHGVTSPSSALPKSNIVALAKAAEENKSGPLRIWAATGPFCLHNEYVFIFSKKKKKKIHAHTFKVLILFHSILQQFHSTFL
jgi:hypothetical protein